jgi:hypothetical protein
MARCVPFHEVARSPSAQFLVFGRFAFEPLSLLDLADLVSAMCDLPKGLGEVAQFLCTQGGPAFRRRHNLDMARRGCEG